MLQSGREEAEVIRLIAQLRNEDDAKIMERIMTLSATWKLQGKNSFNELRSLL